MELGKAINDSALLVNKAAKQVAEGDSDGAINTLLDLRKLVGEPIEVSNSDGSEMPVPKCDSCGQDL